MSSHQLFNPAHIESMAIIWSHIEYNSNVDKGELVETGFTDVESPAVYTWTGFCFKLFKNFKNWELEQKIDYNVDQFTKLQS